MHDIGIRDLFIFQTFILKGRWIQEWVLIVCVVQKCCSLEGYPLMRSFGESFVIVLYCSRSWSYLEFARSFPFKLKDFPRNLVSLSYILFLILVRLFTWSLTQHIVVIGMLFLTRLQFIISFPNLLFSYWNMHLYGSSTSTSTKYKQSPKR